MKTITLTILLISVLLIAGCAQKVTYQCNDGTIVEDLQNCPPEEVIEEPEPEPELPPEEPEEEVMEEKPTELPEEVAELFKKSSTVESIQYEYLGPDTTPEREKWLVKGNKARVRPDTGVRHYRNNDHDTIYLDFETQKAEGYCEVGRLGSECDDWTTLHPLEFSDYKRMTPTDWIEKVPSDAERKAGIQVDQRTTQRLDWTDEEGEWTMYVYDFFGLPIKVEKTTEEGTETWMYMELAVNLVEDSDLEHVDRNDGY